MALAAHDSFGMRATDFGASGRARVAAQAVFAKLDRVGNHRRGSEMLTIPMLGSMPALRERCGDELRFRVRKHVALLAIGCRETSPVRTVRIRGRDSQRRSFSTGRRVA